MNWRGNRIGQIVDYNTARGKNYFSTQARKAWTNYGLSINYFIDEVNIPYGTEELILRHDELLRRNYLVFRLLSQAQSWHSMKTVYFDIQNRRRGDGDRALLEKPFQDWYDAQKKYQLDFQDLTDITFAIGANIGGYLPESPRLQGPLDWAAFIHEMVAGRDVQIPARHAYSWFLWRYVQQHDGPEYAGYWNPIFDLARGLKGPQNSASILERVDQNTFAKVAERIVYASAAVSPSVRRLGTDFLAEIARSLH
jgi:hypothetical protein